MPNFSVLQFKMADQRPQISVSEHEKAPNTPESEGSKSPIDKQCIDENNTNSMGENVSADNASQEKALFKMPAIVPKFSVNKTSSQQFMNAEKTKSTVEPPVKAKAKQEIKVDEQLVPKAKKQQSSLSPAEKLKQLETPIPYKEPAWGGPSDSDYFFEVLKNGRIISKLELSTKSFHVFGRLPSCDFPMEHPSLSRHHSVVQHCSKKTDKFDVGWYLYDLDSTHGTWVNKIKVRPRVYHRLRVGHVMKLGGSSRLLILQVILIYNYILY